MQLASLETFIAILEEGSLIGAAHRLHVSQSTVTARLQTLERELGCELLHRSKSGVTPTPAGHRVRRNVETMIDLWTQAQRDISRPDTVLDVCTIGCLPDLWTGCVDSLVHLAMDRSAGLALSVRQGSIAELAEWQRAGVTDLSVTYAASPATAQRSWPLAADELVLVSTDPQAPVHFDPGYVLIEADDDFARRHTATYATAAIARVTFDAPALGLDHIRRRGGSAYLPLRMVEPLIDDGELHLLTDGPSFTREIHLVAASDAPDRWPWFNEALASLVG